jgi:hypothetical protein
VEGRAVTLLCQWPIGGVSHKDVPRLEYDGRAFMLVHPRDGNVPRKIDQYSAFVLYRHAEMHGWVRAEFPEEAP